MNSLHQSLARWFIFQDDHLLLLKDNTLPTTPQCASITSDFLRCHKLEWLDDIEYHCAEIDKNRVISDEFHSLPLKQALFLFDNKHYGLAVKARSLIYWDKNHQFCGRCGRSTVHQAEALERKCPSCALSVYPRISPSIIVRIKKNDHILMARSPHFSPGVYSLIAGFVDIGESIEDAVHREVREEVGLEIKNLAYWGSQPWPFPDSLMLAFTADYASGEIIMEPNEIEDAGWYKHDNLPGLPSTPISIAMKLIDEFISQR